MLYRGLADIKINGCLIFMGFRTGDTELFTWEEEAKELYRLAQDKMDEHEEELASIDLLQSRGLFVTGGRDGLIKVWNIKKQMIREIKFPEPITSVSFLNSEGDILVGHVGKVSSVMAIDYKPFEVKELSQPSQAEIEKFINQPLREAASDDTFKKLKKADDDLRRQIIELTKKSPVKAIEEEGGPGQSSPTASPGKAGVFKNKHAVSRSFDRGQKSSRREASPRSENSDSILNSTR